MQALPHQYLVEASLYPDRVDLKADKVTTIESEPPTEFGGSGTRWSPETLFVAAIADCFLLTFKAIARASKFEYADIKCEVQGTLDRVEGITRFTTITVRPILRLDAGDLTDDKTEKAVKLLHKAEKGRLISNSLTSEVLLQPTVQAMSTS